MTVCHVCSRDTDLHLCASCLGELTAALRSVPWLVDELTVTLTRQAREGDRNGAARSAERPLPFHAGASVDLETLAAGLGMWADLIAAGRGVRVDAYRAAPDLARWLLRWPSEMAVHPDAGELHGDILAMTAAAQRTIDRRPDLRFVGPCDGHQASTLPDDVECCGRDLYVGVQAREVVCRTEGCGAVYPIEARRAWLLEAAYNQLRTPAEISQALGELFPGKPITANLISQWAARGLRIDGDRRHLTPYLPDPRDPHRRTRYSVEEVVAFYRAAHGIAEPSRHAA